MCLRDEQQIVGLNLFLDFDWSHKVVNINCSITIGHSLDPLLWTNISYFCYTMFFLPCHLHMIVSAVLY